MPKPTGFTARGKIERHLRMNPGHYRSRKLAQLFKVSQSTAAAVLSELALNYPRLVQRRLDGRNTHYYVNFGDANESIQ